MNRKPYKYQYSAGTLTMNGWCGLDDTEQEWLRQLEFYVDTQRDKYFNDIGNNDTVEDIAVKYNKYKRNTHDALGQISRLRLRMNYKYGKLGR